MTSSSPERVLPVALPDLRGGGWTRLGSSDVVGDAVTEQLLTGLADRTAEAARAQGYATGWAEGRREAAARAAEESQATAAAASADAARREAEHRAALAALVERAAEAGRAASATVTALEDRVVEVAVAVAEAVLGAELAVVDHAALTAARRALALVPAGQAVRLRLHPEAAAALDVDAVLGDVTVVADPAVALGDALAENDDLLVDATVATALDRVREALR